MARRSSSKAIIRRRLLKAVRNLSLEVQAGILIGVGVVVGFLLGFTASWGRKATRNCPDSPIAQNLRISISSTDRCGDLKSPCYVFVFGTGRSGTQHLSRVLKPKPSPAVPVYVTHEEEHLRARTKLVVHRDYRRLAASADKAQFRVQAEQYVTRVKLPFYTKLLKRHSAKRLVYTGHLPMAFGLGPALVRTLPPGTVRVLRLRRERIATAVSLMALGPEKEDPWGATTERDSDGQLTYADAVNRRWFPKPSDAMVRLHVEAHIWAKLNRFQRWLWYVDDVECRWQAFRHSLGSRFSLMEESLENLNMLDGGQSLVHVAEFMGVAVDWSKAGARDNSIEHKMRVKVNASESSLRQWDEAYRQAVGSCRISSKYSYGWGGRHPET